MKLKCEECSTVSEFELKEEVRGEITRVYLSCPNCMAEHDVMYQNQEIRDLIQLNRATGFDYETLNRRKQAIIRIDKRLRREWKKEYGE